MAKWTTEDRLFFIHESLKLMLERIRLLEEIIGKMNNGQL